MPDPSSASSEPVSSSISQNIDTIEEYYKREDQRIGPAQRLLERLGNSIGRPLSLAVLVIFVAAWIGINLFANRLGIRAFDPVPFSVLQGIVSLGALLTTLIVLTGQNRLAKLEQRREHLELQLNILTEQKTTKLIHLLEELRHDLPMVRDREDPAAAELQRPTDTQQILSALEEAQTDSDKSSK